MSGDVRGLTVLPLITPEQYCPLLFIGEIVPLFCMKNVLLFSRRKFSPILYEKMFSYSVRENVLLFCKRKYSYILKWRKCSSFLQEKVS